MFKEIKINARKRLFEGNKALFVSSVSFMTSGFIREIILEYFTDVSFWQSI